MNPMGAAGLSKIRRFPGRSNTLGRRSDASRLACNSACSDAEDSSVRGDQRGRKPLRRPGNGVLRRGLEDPGTTYVEPVRAGSSVFKAVELSTSYSSEFETVKHHGRRDAAGAAMRHGLPVRKGLAGENLMSGSGPSVSARPEGEQAVEGVRNPEDGRCRVRQARDVRIPSPTSLERRGTPGGAIRSGMTGEGTSARTLRGRRSLREQPGGLRTARTVGRRNTSWSYKRRGGGGEPMTPLRRPERSERPVNPERVVRGTATSRGTAEALTKPLEGPRRTYLSQPPAKKA
jgi:hypothetical protein